ncbi:MAG TPA: DUF3568 family protein [Candidatus Omnitrophota bacterium]|nr:DUF3568 family protein [Candidatus Omnitrophota bacterium]HPT07445.1 DUF3568 family protein [Candidatus Omnitrophota bacterium]
MKKNLLGSIIFILVIGVSGCAPLIVGAAVGGAGAYAVSKDTLQGDTDKPYDALWSAALSIAKVKGTVILEDYHKGMINLNIEGGKVWIRFIRLTRTATRVKVSARKFHMPSISSAQDIYTKIMDEAR